MMAKKAKKAKKKAAGRKRTARKSAARKPAAPNVATASQIVKRAAAGQRIVVSLTEEQFEQLARNFKPEGGGAFDPRRPFQIDFESSGRRRSVLPVASCAFWSDTCCV